MADVVLFNPPYVPTPEGTGRSFLSLTIVYIHAVLSQFLNFVLCLRFNTDEVGGTVCNDSLNYLERRFNRL